MDQYSYYLPKPSKIFYINIELAEQHSPVFGVAVAHSTPEQAKPKCGRKE
jgi:hypothetical protein